MQLRQTGDTKVSALGLGGMPMSIEGRPDESRSIATVDAALDAGVTLIDTADAYHIGADEVGHNEAFAQVAQEVDATAHQVTLAWMLARSPAIIPIRGSSRPETIRASAAAVDLQLTPEQVRRLDESGTGPA